MIQLYYIDTGLYLVMHLVKTFYNFCNAKNQAGEIVQQSNDKKGCMCNHKMIVGNNLAHTRSNYIRL